MLHFPSERQGCQYERSADCCWLCRLRRADSPKRSYRVPIEEETGAEYNETDIIVRRPNGKVH